MLNTNQNNMDADIIDIFKQKTAPFGELVFICRTGSKAYGLDTPESDDDFRSIFIPKVKYILGLQNVEQIKVKDDDWIAHDIRQFIKIVIKQNPTILEMLFADKIVYESPLWVELRPKLKQLITKQAFKPYSAYVKSQLRKAELDKITQKRKELIEKYEYDCKFMSHVARLAVQCIYLMETGEIPVKVPHPFRTTIMAIKTGKVKKDDAWAYCNALDIQMHESYKKSKLSESVDLNKFEHEVYIPLMRRILDVKSPRIYSAKLIS